LRAWRLGTRFFSRIVSPSRGCFRLLASAPFLSNSATSNPKISKLLSLFINSSFANRKMASTSSIKDSSTTQVEGIPKEFEALDESLRCSICRHHYHEAVTMRPCGDSFCLECIQKTLRTDLNSNRRQISCPKCGDNISSKVDDCLIPNRGLQESALAWRGYLKSL
jgi:hypothetical protein